MAGRPSIEPTGGKPVELKILVSQDIHRSLNVLARGLGMSTSGYVRTLIYNQISRIHSKIEDSDASN